MDPEVCFTLSLIIIRTNLSGQMETVRHLHVLSSQLIRLRRSLTPLLHVCYVIRDQDIQRSAAASAVGQGYGGETNENAEGSRKEQDGLGHSAGRMSGTGAAAGAGMEYNPFSPPSGGSQHSQAMSFTDFAQPQPRPLMPSHNVAPTAPPTSSISRGVSRSSTPVPGVVPRARQSDTDAASVLSMMNLHQSYKNLAALGTPHTGVGIGAASLGFFSPLTKVYIEDVIDHLEIIVGSLEQFVSTCDHLTDYVFVSPLFILIYVLNTNRMRIIDKNQLIECFKFPNKCLNGKIEHCHCCFLA